MAFIFRLARDLGKSIPELLDTMTHQEFAAWAAFYSAEVKVQQALRSGR